MRLPALLRRRTTRETLLLLGLVAVVFALLSSFFQSEGTTPGKYLVAVAIVMGIYALFALGLSVEIGYAGLLNFGHVAFMGIGAYTAVIFWRRAGASLGPQLAGEGLGGLLFAALVGLVAALAVYTPLLALARRLRARPRAQVAAALAPALAAGLLVAAWAFPLSERNAQSAVFLLGGLLGMALAAVGGLLLGFAALRLREDYLAIVTLGTSQILLLVWLNEEWLTGGSEGIFTFPNPVSDWARGTEWFRDFARGQDLLPAPLALAVVTVVCVALVYAVLEIQARSPWGRVLKAIREDEDVAAALGKNVLWYKLQALMIGSAIAALAGVLFVWYLGSIVPTQFVALVTFTTFGMLVLGGVGNHRGAIIGAVLIWGIFELGNNLTFLDRYGLEWAGPLQNMFVGLVLILVVMFRPQGAVGTKEELSLGK